MSEIALPLAHPGGHAPGQEFGIFLDVSDQVEQLLAAVRQDPFLGVRRHGRKLSPVGPPPSTEACPLCRLDFTGLTLRQAQGEADIKTLMLSLSKHEGTLR
jgi:hypothetical protein